MPPITALLHTKNDALRLGRALETLLPCAELLIVDHQSSDATVRVALEYGARIMMANVQSGTEHYLSYPRHDWILCLDPSESITEGLEATLLEWSSLPNASPADAHAFSMFVRQAVAGKWRRGPAPETRLIPRNWTGWNGRFPSHEPSATALEGELLRIDFP
jgi:glycosyltransferase involved in cell wall biosynthesis